jgi:hypothetical protein
MADVDFPESARLFTAILSRMFASWYISLEREGRVGWPIDALGSSIYASGTGVLRTHLGLSLQLD